MNASLRALNRFGLGARPGEPGRIGDPRGWLRNQLVPSSALLRTSGLPTQQEAFDAVSTLVREQRRQRQDPTADTRDGLEEAGLDDARGTARRLIEAEARATMDRRLQTESPYLERLVAFWSNHLCVSPAGKVRLLTFPGLYEREVIRPHVLGRYRDMVLASARHPAMLLYLDNMQSMGPRSEAAARAARLDTTRERGLNENYARELLELHTLGVDGGYQQADVEQLARIFTGWTLQGLPLAEAAARAAAPPENQMRRAGTARYRARQQSLRRMGFSADVPFGFAFRAALHEPGDKTVLGKSYREGEGAGREAISDLCAHPSTARHLALKLARHFIADEPPARAVNEIAAVFQDTEGDLLRVSQALIDLPEAWSEDSAKFRTPQDWFIAAGRALGVDTFPPRVGLVLRDMRQPLWAPPSPKGYDDLMGPWADPDSLMNRAEMSRTVADAVALRADPTALLEVVETRPDGGLATLLADRSIPVSERVALAIGGPDFQWR